MHQSLFVIAGTALVTALSLAACKSNEPAPAKKQAGPVEPQPVQVAGLHNVFRINDRLYSGSGPHGDESYESLAKLGVKAVISVDGALPDIEAARKAGLRYVHIPIGYHGVPREQQLLLAKAVREIDGPIYVHCHHGKHRGPAAAAVALLAEDATCSPDEAMAVLKKAGTDPRYKGLFASVASYQVPTAAEMASLPATLPEAAKVGDLAAAMVAIDRAFDNLKLARATGFKTPTDHPDIDPPHEALQLLEAYVELSRLPAMKQKPADFQQWLSDGQTTAAALEKALRVEGGRPVDVDRAEKAYRSAAAVCSRCHARYRDE